MCVCVCVCVCACACACACEREREREIAHVFLGCVKMAEIQFNQDVDRKYRLSKILFNGAILFIVLVL